MERGQLIGDAHLAVVHAEQQVDDLGSHTEEVVRTHEQIEHDNRPVLRGRAGADGTLRELVQRDGELRAVASQQVGDR